DRTRFGKADAALAGVLAHECQRAAVAVEQAVPALRLVRRIAHVGAVAVDEPGVGMRRARLSVPRPEIAAHDRAAVRPRGFDRIEYHAVVAVAVFGRRLGRIAFAVAREAELLEQQRHA